MDERIAAYRMMMAMHSQGVTIILPAWIYDRLLAVAHGPIPAYRAGYIEKEA